MTQSQPADQPDYELLPYQQLARDFIITRPRAGVFITMGGGKSLTTLDALRTIRPSGHILVTAPPNIARSVWLSEIRKFKIPLRTRSLIVDEKSDKPLSYKARLARYDEIFTDPPTMYFTTCDLFKDLVERMPRIMHRGKKIPLWPFPTVILDEAQMFKSHDSARFEAFQQVSSQMRRVIELSGTPAPQSLQDLWALAMMLDGGKALGPSFPKFQETYFDEKTHPNASYSTWSIKPGYDRLIHQAVSDIMMSTKNTDVPLPDVEWQRSEVVLPAHLQERYDEFERDQVISFATPSDANPDELVITAEHAGALRAKLLQFASGIIYTGEDHDREFLEVHEEKIDMLDYHLREIDCPSLVAYTFRADRMRLPSALAKRGHQAVVFDGSLSMIEAWNRREIPALLLHPKSAGHGLNLQHGGESLIWYSLPDPLQDYLQTNSRLIRPGSRGNVRITSIVTANTRDALQPGRLYLRAQGQQGFLDDITHMPPPPQQELAQAVIEDQAYFQALLNEQRALGAA